jgi:hypothetical protein
MSTDLRPDTPNPLALLVTGRPGLHKDFNVTLEHMTMDEIVTFIGSLEGVLTLKPVPGDGSPEISWGDMFFYYAPDGAVPARTQPFATVVTKNYPGDDASRLDRPDAFRVNVSAGKEAFVRWIGREPREPATTDVDPSTVDTVIAHPVYGTVGWLAVVNPGPRTDGPIRELLRDAYDVARSRYQRRAERSRAS